MVGFLFSSHFQATESSKLIYNFLFEAILPLSKFLAQDNDFPAL